MAEQYRKGIENIPLRNINKDMPILVVVYDLNNNENVVQELRMNYGDAEDRKHLGRITFWAITNHCTVETMAIADAEPEIKMENK